MRDPVRDIPAMVCFTTHTWCSCNCKGYSALFMFWIGRNWSLRRAFLNFQRFLTSHNEENISTLLFKLLPNWNLLEYALVVTTDDARKICLAMINLVPMLITGNITTRLVTDIDLRYIAHVANLVFGLIKGWWWVCKSNLYTFVVYLSSCRAQGYIWVYSKATETSNSFAIA